MSAYQLFNTAEAAVWLVIAVAIVWKVDRTNRAQQWGVVLGAVAFVLFGVTDVLEIPSEGRLPMWLWAFKVLCGVMILCARYTWLGWNRFRWQDREVVFGLSCLCAVVVVIALQLWLN